MESILVLMLHCKVLKGEEESVQKRAVRFVMLNYSYKTDKHPWRIKMGNPPYKKKE